jgi:hypothetical protein
MKRLVLPLAIVALLAAVSTSMRPAYACSCTGPTLPQAQVDAADTIVIGTVARVFDNPYTIENSAQPEDEFEVQDVDAVVHVERYLKGGGPAEIIVDDPQHGGGCGILEERSLNSRYMLFLSGEDSPFTTTLCSGSLPIEGPGLVTLAVTEEYAAAVVEGVTAVTGPGNLPSSDAAAPSGSSSDTPWLAIAIGGAALAGAGAGLAAAAAWLVRRRLAP